MSNKKITDFTDGVRFEPGDLVLADRAGRAISLPGAIFAVTRDQNPPLASQFPNSMYGWGATGPLQISDGAQGLITTISGSTDPNGFRAALRDIPTTLNNGYGGFTFTAKLSYSAASRAGTGLGIVVATAGTGNAGSALTIMRERDPSYGNLTASIWNYVTKGYYGISDNFSNLTGQAANLEDCSWYQIYVEGTQVTLRISPEGVNWTKYMTQDMGAPVTQYGFAMMHRTPTLPGQGLVTYFDSDELPFKRF